MRQEGNIPPQVVFEIRSPSNTRAEIDRKLEIYQTYGVEEYYLYDPDNRLLAGWRRRGDQLVEIPEIQGWCSPQLGIWFDLSQGKLVIYRPDGQRFLSSVELAQRTELAEQRAEAERRRAEKLAAYLRTRGLDPDNLPEV